MVYHDWSDKNFDWDSMNKACNYLDSFCKTYGRLGGQVKEKYGTLRFYAQFGNMSLHNLLYPKYHYIRYPKFIHFLDLYLIEPTLNFLFKKIFVKYQEFIYNKGYQHILNKWPHLRNEFLCSADYPKLIKGATKIEENDKEIILHILDWDGNTISKLTELKN